MHNYNYRVENSKLYLNFPISFNSIKYNIHIMDAGEACTLYGAYKISANKIQILNIALADGYKGHNYKTIQDFYLALYLIKK